MNRQNLYSNHQTYQQINKRESIYFFKDDKQVPNRYTKKYSLLLIIRKSQIKTKEYHPTPIIMTYIKKSVQLLEMITINKNWEWKGLKAICFSNSVNTTLLQSKWEIHRKKKSMGYKGQMGELGKLVVENDHWWRDGFWNTVCLKLNFLSTIF